MSLVNRGWGTFCVLLGMGRVWSTQVEINFVPSLVWEDFGQNNLSLLAYERFGPHLLSSCGLLIGIGWDWSTLVETKFVPSLAHGLHILRWIICPRWNGMGLVHTYSVKYCIGWQGMEWWNALCFLPGFRCVWSIQFDMHFVNSLAWEVFCHYLMIYILRPRCHGMGIVKTCWHGIFVHAGTLWIILMHFVLAGMGEVRSTHV